MKTIKFSVLLFLLAGLLFISSCNDSNKPTPPKLTGVMVINEGNFGQGNGSISFYDEEQMTITNNVVKSANSGQEIGSTVQSVTPYGSIGYVVCNSTDKIEIINLENYKYLANPVTNINQPRYMIGSGERGYITCWGPWSANWTLDSSYVAVMDLVTNEIVDSLECGSGPEGIINIGNKIYVANSYETTISVIHLQSGQTSTIQLHAYPKHFEFDTNSTLWVSVTSGFDPDIPPEQVGLQSINIDTDALESFVQVKDLNGKMALSGDGQVLYLLTAQPWPGTKTEIWTFNTIAKKLSEEPLITGDNFYGLGVNPTTGKIYVADAAAFAGNGRVLVYDQQGDLLDEQTTGVGPNGFLFK